MAGKKKVIIVGAAGRDFHNFNTYYRGNPDYEVVAFTAAQIPDISGRKYPVELAGKEYPDGIPIEDEARLTELIKKHGVDDVVFSYSDLSHEQVMHIGSTVLAAGANYVLLGPNATMVKSTKPLISVCAVRTGSGKSQTTRRVCEVLKKMGKRVAAIRHPMPYGNLAEQAVQRFAAYSDLDKHKCTIEEREEYEPHIDRGNVIYAGVDYEKILRQAETEADVIVWDGGNNDFSFYKSDLYITVADPHRPGHELRYHPGETNVRLADVVVINKVDTARPEDVETVRKNVASVNPRAKIILAASPVTLEHPELVKGKRVLVVEDGPTVTHGGMGYGAGFVAAKQAGAAEIIDPRPFAVGSIKGTFQKYSHLHDVLPAMGYGDKQVSELKATIDASDADVVVGGTPIDLNRVMTTNKKILRVGYELREETKPGLEEIIRQTIK
ncbi:Cyclic 2,3-diphosphoglycerate synthetase [Candidatus Norongarragalina meridionalis]|nr:Cyclic 2,3-diphosphoglycerate synthetase [Candidatus Norongarragalina meridionalis]